MEDRSKQKRVEQCYRMLFLPSNMVCAWENDPLWQHRGRKLDSLPDFRPLRPTSRMLPPPPARPDRCKTHGAHMRAHTKKHDDTAV